ncbi:MAG: AEC family transporter [Methylococcaceae bacterium]|nr:AEC family transporter [Methylococcaceae bacterium]
MTSILAQMGLLIFCGLGWRIIRPGGLDADPTRRVLTTLVYHLLLPALVLSVLWKQAIGLEALRVSAFGFGLILLGLALTWLASKILRLDDRRLGAALLAIGFPNVTYFGLPLLEQTFGPWSRILVIQIDLFATLPALLLLGAVIGQRYGERRSGTRAWPAALNNPPVWAAAAGIILNQNRTPLPGWLDHALDRLSAPVVPCMLIALGLGLGLGSWQRRNLPWAALAMSVRLLAVPWLSVSLGRGLGFAGDTLTALVLEAGMPSMLLGVVYCDRYRLDTHFYAMVAALTTVGAAFTLPYWHGAVSSW